jgi:hypothetical protein
MRTSWLFAAVMGLTRVSVRAADAAPNGIPAGNLGVKEWLPPGMNTNPS